MPALVTDDHMGNALDAVCCDIDDDGVRASAIFNNDGVTGTITFTQSDALRTTRVRIGLKGLPRTGVRYMIHELDTPFAGTRSSVCDGTGELFNPLRMNYNQCSQSRPDLCPLGEPHVLGTSPGSALSTSSSRTQMCHSLGQTLSSAVQWSSTRITAPGSVQQSNTLATLSPRTLVSEHLSTGMSSLPSSPVTLLRQHLSAYISTLTRGSGARPLIGLWGARRHPPPRAQTRCPFSPGALTRHS